MQKKIFLFAQDPLFRGFFLLSCLLLGVGLEQSLLHSHSTAWELSFLAGNFLGLFFGLYLWDKTRISAHLPLRLWFLEGLLVGLLVWKQNPVLAFILGLFFGPLVLHLFLLSTGSTFKHTLLRVGAGIISGNIFLFILGHLPKDLALVFLALSMVGWRVRRPGEDQRVIFRFSPPRKLLFFWAFFFLFYILGGLYYACLLGHGLSFPKEYFSIISLTSYVAGIVCLLFLGRYIARFLPPLLVMLMGFSLVWQLASARLSLVSLGSMEFAFGLADVFSIVYIFQNSGSLLEGALGLSLFPLSISAGLLVLSRHVSSFIQEYQWALSALFATMLPALFLTKYDRLPKDNQNQKAILCLPAGGSCPEKDLSSSKPFPEKETLSPKEAPTEENSGPEVTLSEREREVYRLLLQDKKLKEIARELGLALGTVKTLCGRVYEKLGVKNKKELLSKFIERP